MPSLFDVRDDISSGAVDQLMFDLDQDQISCVFDLSDFIREQIIGYCNESLGYTADLVSLWSALGWPQPDDYAEPEGANSGDIIDRMRAGVQTALLEHENIIDDTTRAIASWALTALSERNIDVTDLDDDDAEELVRALA